MHTKFFNSTEYQNLLSLEGKAPKRKNYQHGPVKINIPEKYFLARLFELNTDFGTGFAISESYIVTTAENLVRFFVGLKKNIDHYHAMFGKEDCVTNILYKFTKVEIHGRYNSTGLKIDNNIGLITVFNKIYIL